MTISNYGELKTEVEDYTHRTDLTAKVPLFIQLAESRINSDLEDFAMESRASYTVPGGQRFTTLPSDMRKLMNVEIAVSGGRRLLMPLSQAQIDSIHAFVTTGVPTNYALTGDQMELQPTPGENTEVEIFYQYRLAGFSDDADTNAILTKFPNIYLYASLLEYALYVQADERIPPFRDAYGAEVARINDEAYERQMSGGPLQIINLGTSTP